MNVLINQVKKNSKGGGFGLNQAPVDTNILSTQIKVCACPMDYFPLPHTSTPTKEATSNKRESLYGQIILQRLFHDNKGLK